MSDQEIETGRRWNEEIAKALDDTDFGLVCVTADQHAPWLMFEAGGLAKRLGVGRVVPLRIGLKSAQLKEPLARFQGVDLDKEGVRKLIQDIMVLRQDNPLAQA
jgi:TIR domain-containing protein